MRFRTLLWLPTLAISLVLTSGCLGTNSDSDGSSGSGMADFFRIGMGPHLSAGTTLRVRLLESLSSETTRSGDRWHGVVTAPVFVEGKEAIPEGSPVEGVVSTSIAAQRGNRAELKLALRKVQARDHETTVYAESRAVTARSPRTRNLGAIAGGVAAGALLGKAIGNAPGTGAIVGGGVATGVVAASKGYQVRLPEGTVMTFTIAHEVAMR